MNSVKLAFYRGVKKENKSTTFLDRLICWVTQSRYSHLEVVVYYNRETGASLCWSSSPRDGGVRWKLIDLHSGNWDVVSVESSKTIQEIKDWFDSYEGSKYDWFGAVASKFSWFRENPTLWFCSEAVATAMGLDRPDRFTPKSLYEHFAPTAKHLYP